MRHRLPSAARDAMLDNLAAAYPSLSTASLVLFARQCLSDIKADEVRQYRLQLLARPLLLREIAKMDVVGAEHLNRVYADDRPVIFVTAHYGSFMLAALKAALEFPGRRLNFFYNPSERNSYAATSDSLLGLANESCGILHNTPQGVMSAIRCLRRGESLCIVADQITPEGDIVFVPFFGRFYGAMQGVAFFARRSNAHVLPAFARTRADGRTILEFHEPIDPMQIHGALEEEWLYRMTCEVFAAFERQIRNAPTHWRYWRSFKRSSLGSPLPPASREAARSQVTVIQELLTHDVSLCADQKIWDTANGIFDAR
ncbi:MAG: lysophospholipid acyltransferase family protein [Opitutae bacterium]|nr:lysophospholipid acyltransferase family protein [Opitutae bacterium]